MLNNFLDRNKTPYLIHGRFCGPGNDVIDQIQRGITPLTELDSHCKQHDLAYHRFKDIPSRHAADKILASQAWQRVLAPDSSLKERLAALAISGVMRGKVTVGAGLKKRKRIHRKRPVVKGGFLPALIAAALAGGASLAQIYKSVSDVQKGKNELLETQRHNMALEANRSIAGGGGRGRHLRRRRNTRLRATSRKTPSSGKGLIMKQFRKR